MSDQRPYTILCLASEYKGIPFIEECHRQGARVLLVTADACAGADWPWDRIAEHFHMPDLSKQPDITHAVSYLMRSRPIDRIVALDDYDVGTAAALREHLRLPGMGQTTARHFRDKLAMRMQAADAGALVPPFTAVFNHAQLAQFMDNVSPPWVLKPRSEAGAIGIQKMHHAEEVWAALEKLGDQQSYFLLEQFIPGDVFHVDAVVWDKKPAFALASQYGQPPMTVAQGGGVFTTRTLPADGETAVTLLDLNQKLTKALGLLRGVMHTEFIQGYADGRFYFLETAARVGGANIDRLVRAASGIELWAEAARVELAHLRGETYQLPPIRQDAAGLLICLARQQRPDLSAYDDPEIVWRLPKEYHAGLLIAAPDAGRVEALLADYANRFARDFLAVTPPKEQTRYEV